MRASAFLVLAVEGSETPCIGFPFFVHLFRVPIGFHLFPGGMCASAVCMLSRMANKRKQMVDPAKVDAITEFCPVPGAGARFVSKTQRPP